MPSTLLTSGDATAGTALTSGNDGVLVLQSGTAGSKVEAISLAPNGQATLKQPPKLDAAAVVSMVRVDTANGYGSTNTCIRRYTNVRTNTGSDITYTDSPTLGASFVLNTSGIYAISTSEQANSSGCWIGIVLDGTANANSVVGISSSSVLAIATNQAGNGYPATASWTGWLPSGSTIRPQTAGTAAGSTVNGNIFTITRIG